MSRRVFIYCVLAITLIAGLVRMFLVEPFQIESTSMLPTLEKGQTVWVEKFVYGIRLPFSSYQLARISLPKRSEVVAFSLPEFGQQTFIKRIIALSSDRFEIRKQKILVNGVAALRQTTAQSIETTEHIDDYGPIEIPLDHFFAMADDPKNTNDSRRWGPIPYTCLRGRVRLTFLRD